MCANLHHSLYDQEHELEMFESGVLRISGQEETAGRRKAHNTVFTKYLRLIKSTKMARMGKIKKHVKYLIRKLNEKTHKDHAGADKGCRTSCFPRTCPLFLPKNSRP